MPIRLWLTISVRTTAAIMWWIMTPETGEVRKRQTAQGYADESAWARGQAWACTAIPCAIAIHTMPNTWSRLKRFTTLSSTTRIFRKTWSLPGFRCPHYPRNEPRDASAAACTASALYGLSTYLPGKGYKGKPPTGLWKASLLLPTVPRGTNGNFILMHLWAVFSRCGD